MQDQHVLVSIIIGYYMHDSLHRARLFASTLAHMSELSCMLDCIFSLACERWGSRVKPMLTNVECPYCIGPSCNEKIVVFLSG